MQNHFDTIVIGVGSMGSATCWQLAKEGQSVLGLEQFDIVHEKGSHTGQSRIIRKAYFEHPAYVPLLERAYTKWNAFEQLTGHQLYYRTGIVYFGMPETNTLAAVEKSALLHNVVIERPSMQQIQKQFPVFEMPANFEVIFEPDAGFVLPEKAISLYVQEAVKQGAVIKTNEGVITWQLQAGKIMVTTSKDIYTSDKLVITAGPWASKMIPNLPAKLVMTEQMLAWVKPFDLDAFRLGNFPCWFIDDPELGIFYGFPELPVNEFEGPAGLKLAHHFPGSSCDPDKRAPVDNSKTVENIRYVLEKYLPKAAGEILSTKQCLYTSSTDEHFIIDHLPGYDKQVVIACGFSGHGFKFIPVVAEILADLVISGDADLPIDFLRLSRFGG